MTLAGRVCVITGATRGIGRATARRAAELGATVVGTYRERADDAAALTEEVGATGGRLAMRRCDVTDQASVAGLVGSVLADEGRIDALVNNAGVWRGGRLERLEESDWRTVIEVDLAATFSVTRAVLGPMLAAGQGRIVNVTSVVGVLGYPGDTAYAAAKAGVNAMTKSLAKEVARQGLAVNAVAPGPVATDMTEGLGDRARERLVAKVPLGRQGQPEEIAEVIAFLLDAPMYLNGAVIGVDGAMS